MSNDDHTTPVPPETAPAVESAAAEPAPPVGDSQPEPPAQQSPTETATPHPAASQQMAEGLKQFAAGAKNFLQNTARPAAVAAVSAAKEKTEQAVKNRQPQVRSATAEFTLSRLWCCRWRPS